MDPARNAPNPESVVCAYCNKKPKGTPRTFKYNGLEEHTKSEHYPRKQRLALKGCRKCLNYYPCGRLFDNHFKNCGYKQS